MLQRYSLWYYSHMYSVRLDVQYYVHCHHEDLMTTDETDYATLSTHSKMAAAMPPCVQLLVVWFPCTERFYGDVGRKWWT